MDRHGTLQQRRSRGSAYTKFYKIISCDTFKVMTLWLVKSNPQGNPEIFRHRPMARYSNCSQSITNKREYTRIMCKTLCNVSSCQQPLPIYIFQILKRFVEQFNIFRYFSIFFGTLIYSSIYHFKKINLKKKFSSVDRNLSYPNNEYIHEYVYIWPIFLIVWKIVCKKYEPITNLGFNKDLKINISVSISRLRTCS